LSDLTLNQRFPPQTGTRAAKPSYQSGQGSHTHDENNPQRGENSYPDIELLFDKDTQTPPSAGNNQLACQSLGELMLVQQLSESSLPIPSFHGPKLDKLASSLRRYKD
jgi:hypothetical protein